MPVRDRGRETAVGLRVETTAARRIPVREPYSTPRPGGGTGPGRDVGIYIYIRAHHHSSITARFGAAW